MHPTLLERTIRLLLRLPPLAASTYSFRQSSLCLDGNKGYLMWRNKQSQVDEPSPPPAPALGPPITPMTPADAIRLASATGRTTARLGLDFDVTGKISGNEDLRIDGTVEEPISLKCHRLTVGSRAKVTAEVMAREVVVYGKFYGNLRALDRIEIKKDGSVIGDLTTARVLIEDGAYFKGNIQIERRKTPRGLPQKRI